MLGLKKYIQNRLQLIGRLQAAKQTGGLLLLAWTGVTRLQG